MRLVVRHAEADLADVLGNDAGRRAKATVEEGLQAGSTLDAGHLRRHVGIAGAVRLVGNDRETLCRRQRHRVGAAGLIEAARPGKNADLGQTARLHVGKQLLDREPVGMRRLEDPFLDRLDDLRATGKRDEGHGRCLDLADDRHGFAGRGAADDGVDLVLLDQPLDEGERFLCFRAGVVDNELDLTAEDATFAVNLLHVRLERLLFGITEKGALAGHGEERAQPDRLGRRSGEGTRSQRNDRKSRDQPPK